MLHEFVNLLMTPAVISSRQAAMYAQCTQTFQSKLLIFFIIKFQWIQEITLCFHMHNTFFTRTPARSEVCNSALPFSF